MMKLFPRFLLAVLFCLLAATVSRAQLNKYVIQCQQGGQTVTTSGVTSSTKHPISYTSSAIRIFQAGTTTDATLYSDASGITPLANPNTCNSVAQFTFYTSEISIDSRLSPSGVTPFTTSGVGPAVIGYASTTRAGITKVSTAPALSTNPIAISQTDPVVNDCIHVASSATGGAGTQGSPYTGVESAITWTANTAYCFDGHYYTWSVAPNWNLEGIKIYGQGANITYTGVGVGMQVNNTSSYNNEILIQDFHVSGNASATDGVLLSGVARSVFRNIQVSKFPQKAFHFKFFVANTADNLTLSINSDGVSTTPHPQYGYYLEYRTSSSEPTEGNNFQNVVIEGATIAAIYGDTAKANNFYIQTLEANGAGVQLTNTSDWNNFFGGDYEANGCTFTPFTSLQGVDFSLVNSAHTSLWNVFSVGSITVGAGASYTYISGALGAVTIAASATGTHFAQFSATSVTDSSAVGNTIYYASGGGNSYTIGRQKFTSVDATTLRTQPTGAGALSLINTPSGNNGSVFSLDSTDRVADAANIAGLGIAANAGAAIRLYSVGVGTATRQNIEISADQATPNSASTQLKLLTGGVVQVNLLAQTEGAVLSISSNTIAPTATVHHVGAGLIKTITVPAGFVSGTIFLIPDSAFTYDTTGNIAAGGGGTATIGRVMTFTWSSSSSKWYASY